MNQPWLNRVRRQLAENNLPPNYIRRFMDELSDHFQDIMEEDMSTTADLSARLGQPNQVADAAVAAYRCRTVLGRHPTVAFLVFGVSPLASMLALFVLAFACMYGAFTAYEQLGFNMNLKRFDPAASALLPYVFSLLMVMIPAGLASLFYCRLIRRLGMAKRWIALSSFVLAVIAILPIWSITLSDQPGQSVLRCGVGSPLDIGHAILAYFSSLQQWLQFLVPLAIGLWFFRQTNKQNHDNEHCDLHHMPASHVCR
jgi:hypothetical protein